MKLSLKIFFMTAAVLSTAAVASCGRTSGTGSDTTSAEAIAKEGLHNEGAVLGDSTDYAIDTTGRIVPTGGKPMIVDFYADWCPPCRRLKPIFHSVAAQMQKDITFVSINVDEHPDLAQLYVGNGIPTLAYILPDGTVAATTEGLVTEEELNNNARKLLDLYFKTQ